MHTVIFNWFISLENLYLLVIFSSSLYVKQASKNMTTSRGHKNQSRTNFAKPHTGFGGSIYFHNKINPLRRRFLKRFITCLNFKNFPLMKHCNFEGLKNLFYGTLKQAINTKMSTWMQDIQQFSIFNRTQNRNSPQLVKFLWELFLAHILLSFAIVMKNWNWNLYLSCFSILIAYNLSNTSWNQNLGTKSKTIKLLSASVPWKKKEEN